MGKKDDNIKEDWWCLFCSTREQRSVPVVGKRGFLPDGCNLGSRDACHRCKCPKSSAFACKRLATEPSKRVVHSRSELVPPNVQERAAKQANGALAAIDAQIADLQKSLDKHGASTPIEAAMAQLRAEREDLQRKAVVEKPKDAQLESVNAKIKAKRAKIVAAEANIANKQKELGEAEAACSDLRASLLDLEAQQHSIAAEIAASKSTSAQEGSAQCVEAAGKRAIGSFLDYLGVGALGIDVDQLRKAHEAFEQLEKEQAEKAKEEIDITMQMEQEAVPATPAPPASQYHDVEFWDNELGKAFANGFGEGLEKRRLAEFIHSRQSKKLRS